jgi:hypothetical protein
MGRTSGHTRTAGDAQHHAVDTDARDGPRRGRYALWRNMCRTTQHPLMRKA